MDHEGRVEEREGGRGERAKRAKRPRWSQERSQENQGKEKKGTEPRKHMVEMAGLYRKEKSGGRERNSLGWRDLR